MRVTFLKDWGVHEVGKTYEIPDTLALDLIKDRVARIGAPNADCIHAQKVMRPSQVKSRVMKDK